MFYAWFEAFYQDCDRLNECEEHPDWKGIVSVVKEVLEAFNYQKQRPIDEKSSLGFQCIT